MFFVWFYKLNVKGLYLHKNCDKKQQRKKVSPMTEAQKKAKAKYKAKVNRFTVDFYPTEADIYEHFSNQDKKQTYLKNLIREDMNKRQGD